MEHLTWYQSLPREVQKTIVDWGEIGPPTAEYQPHYQVAEVAQALRLTPITVRQYIREGRISARKLGRKWVVPVDAIVRFIYNCNGKTANEAVPMGVVFAYADESGEVIANYKFVSSRELATFDSTEAVRVFIGLKQESKYWSEVTPALTEGSLLEDLGLTTPAVDQADRSPYYDRTYDLPAVAKFKLIKLWLQEWYRMPTYMIVDYFKVMFGREPDITDLRLLRLALCAALLPDREERAAEARRWLQLGDLAEWMPSE